MTSDPRLRMQVSQHPYPLMFATISGAHLYGFPSPDSDFDLRGVHLLPLVDVVGLKTGPIGSSLNTSLAESSHDWPRMIAVMGRFQ